MNGDADRDLLAQARAGDREAVAQIVTRHQGYIRRYLARVGPDPVSADDLAQEVFLAALKSMERVDPTLGIRPYLYGVARNLARLAWRERLQGKEIPGDKIFGAIAARCPEEPEPPESERRLGLLQECLRGLAPRALEVVLRHYRHEERCDEIADRLRTTAGNVRSILTRARQILRECVQLKLKAVGP